MRNRVTVGSFTESHRAKGSHPDRRIFTPQIGRLPSQGNRPPQPRSQHLESWSEPPPQRSSLLIQGSGHSEQGSENPESRSGFPKRRSAKLRQRSGLLKPWSELPNQRSGRLEPRSGPLKQRVCPEIIQIHQKPAFSTPSPIGWERAGVRAALLLTFNSP